MTAAGAEGGSTEQPPVVIPDDGRANVAEGSPPATPAPAEAAAASTAAPPTEGGGDVTIDLDVTTATDMAASAAASATTAAGTAAPDAAAKTADLAAPDAGTTDGTATDPTGVAPAETGIDASAPDSVNDQSSDGVAGGGMDAELETLRGDLGELTRDLQRISAEYANYRKRVDRDRLLVGEQATGAVLISLLPVLDDLDRARNHGDLVGPFAAVAEQLGAALQKFGLTPFGETGDRFDPTLHEAVAHMSSADVTETTCVEIMRRGYMLGDRLLRPALVAVADPE